MNENEGRIVYSRDFKATETLEEYKVPHNYNVRDTRHAPLTSPPRLTDILEAGNSLQFS